MECELASSFRRAMRETKQEAQGGLGEPAVLGWGGSPSRPLWVRLMRLELLPEAPSSQDPGSPSPRVHAPLFGQARAPWCLPTKGRGMSCPKKGEKTI